MSNKQSDPPSDKPNAAPPPSPPLIVSPSAPAAADPLAKVVPELAARPILGAPAARVQNAAVMSAWMEHDVATKERERTTALAEADAETALIKSAKETSSDAGLQYENDMGGAGTHPIGVIQVLYANGTRERFMECDIVVTHGAHGISQTLCIQCQIKIDDRNKRFHLDESTKGTPWEDPDTHQIRLLAGTIDVSEICKCDRPGCGFRFRISPHGPMVGVGKLIPE
jgi:hypothetical protein